MDWYANRLRDQLALLSERSLIDSRSGKEILEQAMESGGGGLDSGVIHTDFHPRNMVENASGEVWIVDNEDIRIGALDYDIARSWRQWPMEPGQRDAFCRAYGEVRSLAPFLAYQEFWSICTLVSSAMVHSRARRPIGSFLGPLEKIVRREDDALWPGLPADDAQSK
jgi:Ser/Thr protein kinase RdoA (MazF antagonist)